MITRDWLLSLTYSGKYKCPECSHTRKNKKDRSLSVTIKTDGVVFYCHHCNTKGGEFYERNFTKHNTVRRKEKDKQENSYGFKNRKWTGTVW